MKSILEGREELKAVVYQIAEVTGKRHSDVLEAIRKMEIAWEKVAQRKFSLGSYKDSNNQSRPCYELTKRECLYVATKFNDEARAKLVLRWEELENSQRKNAPALPNFTNPAEAARAWAEQYESRMLEAKRADEAEQQVPVSFACARGGRILWPGDPRCFGRDVFFPGTSHWKPDRGYVCA